MQQLSLFDDALYESIRRILERSSRPRLGIQGPGASVERKRPPDTRAYWLIGRLLALEAKVAREDTASVARQLARRLEQDLGLGYTPGKLRQMYELYRAFPDQSALRPELSWSHYQTLLKVAYPDARNFYHEETAINHWSTRELARQIESRYYERQLAPGGPIKEHFVLEFLGLEGAERMQESSLEEALLNKLQHFLMELGKGFAFIGRQKRVVTSSGKQFYIDLAFYHFLLKCFVLVDLKVGELTHRDIGQMDMYVRLYEDKWRGEGDNPTLGIILCTRKDQTIVQYSILKENRQIFASTYQLYLPTEEELSERLGLRVEEAFLPPEHGQKSP
ncbi:MAG: DUF1016 family protein [Lewinellaceae bacterium]|nr:DUF1016 family protein [Lewinellaceae bacterium]